MSPVLNLGSMDFMFMPSVIQQMAACLLDLTLTLLEKSTVLQKMTFAMLVILGTSQLGMMVLLALHLLTTRFLFLEPTLLWVGLLLSMPIPMILEGGDMSSARPPAMLAEEWLAVSLVFKVKDAISSFQREGLKRISQFPYYYPIYNQCGRKDKRKRKKKFP